MKKELMQVGCGSCALIMFIFCFVPVTRAQGQDQAINSSNQTSNESAATGSVETATGLFQNPTRDVHVFSASGVASTKSLLKEEGQSTGIKLGYTGKLSKLKDKGSLLVKNQLKGKTSMQEDSLSLSLDQGIRVGTVVSLFGGVTKSPFIESQWYGFRFGEWWLEETLQTTLEVRRTSSDGDRVDFTDIDNLRVRTPEKTAGQNVSFGLLNFATPTTILKGSASRTTRSDRPPASAASAEIRQFITYTDSAVHFGLAHYENLGEISKETTFGEVVSNSAKFEWHQNLNENNILSGGYRYYLEVENPRAKNVPKQSVGTDSIYANYRYRFGEGPRAADKDEVYLFAGKYSTSQTITTTFVGIGGRKGL